MINSIKPTENTFDAITNDLHHTYDSEEKAIVTCISIEYGRLILQRSMLGRIGVEFRFKRCYFIFMMLFFSNFINFRRRFNNNKKLIF